MNRIKFINALPPDSETVRCVKVVGTKVCGTKCAIHVGIIERGCTVIADKYCDLWSWDGIVTIPTRLSL
jgi:hypothetical protein